MEFRDPEPEEYYEEVVAELPGFWSRLGGRPDFTGKKVLDLGCGHGALVVDIASHGAADVVGLDLEQSHIDFSQQHQQANHPELSHAIRFLNQDVRDLPEHDFDIMVSKATFEHVHDLESVLGAMRDRLKPGGAIYTGFGPLYFSPFGDHGRTLCKWPWEHAVRSDEALVRNVNASRPAEEQIESIFDLGLNKLTPADYRRIFEESGLRLALYEENLSMPASGVGKKAMGAALGALKHIPGLDKYATVNIWCVLEKQ